MRKFFCGISVILFLCILSFGFYNSYQRTEEKKGQQSPMELSVEQIAEGETVNAAAGQEDGGFFLKEEEGVVIVYKSDRITVYEPTSILTASLPEALRQEIRAGKYLESQEELYSFLENYSS